MKQVREFPKAAKGKPLSLRTQEAANEVYTQGRADRLLRRFSWESPRDTPRARVS